MKRSGDKRKTPKNEFKQISRTEGGEGENKTIYLNAQMDGTQKINLCKNLSSTVIFERKSPRVCCLTTHTNIHYSVLIFGIFELNCSMKMLTELTVYVIFYKGYHMNY